MKKFLFTILISFFVVFSTSFFGCSSSITCWVDYGAFSGVVEYNGEISIEELSLIKQDGKSTSTVEITPSMVVSCDDTTTVGKKNLVVAYAGITYTFEFFVKYKVEFLVNNEVYDTQFVLSADEIELPETPTIENCSFVSWTPNMPETISNNLSIKANFTIAESGIPVLFDCTATYGDTLNQIELPKNNLGSWEFVDDKSTPVGNAGEQYFDVQFVPKDESLIVTTTDTVKIKVAKKTLTFKNVVDTFTYDGTVKVPTFDFDTKENITTEYISYYDGDAIDVNTYEYEIDVNEQNYEGLYSGTLTINPVEIEIVIDDAYIKITDNVPQTYSYKVLDKNGNNLSQNLMNLLEFEILKPNYSHAGNYEISATFNKKNFVVGVNKFEKGTLFVSKVEFDFDGEEPDFVSDKKVTYGSLLSTLEFANTDFRGTWTWTTPNYKVLTPTTITATALFTPKEDKDYFTSTMEIEIPVSKKKIDFVINNNNFTYDATNHSVLFSLDGVETVDDETVSVLGNTFKTNAGTYEVILTVDSNDLRYEGTLSTSLIINKAKMADFTTVYPTTWSKTLLLNNVELLAGYEWVNPLTAVTEIGQQSYLAKFTPVDTDNYEIEQGLIKINVDKATAVILTNQDYAFEYNPNGYSLEGITASHEEATLNYLYSLNQEVVNKISTVGTYSVTISLPETTHYKSAEKTIEVLVNKATNKDAVETNKSATYGQKLSEFAVPNSTTGTWSWETGVETFVGNANSGKQHKLVFTPDDTFNYEAREELVTFNIAKKSVVKPNLNQKTDYNGLPQLAEVDESYYTAPQANNMINVDDYTITLTLKDSANYCWLNEDENLSYLTLTFSIIQTNNSWEENPYIKDWKYLSTEVTPTAKSKFGNTTLIITYKDENGNVVNKGEEKLAAGSYVVVFTVPTTTNYKELKAEKSFTIFPYEVTTPELNQSTVYNGSVQTPTVDETYYAVTINEEIKNAKTYNLTLTLKDNSYVWNDLTTENKVLSFVIDKATNTDVIANQQAIYGQTLSEFTSKLPVSEIGSWGWESDETTLVGPANIPASHKAVFTPISDNYYSREVDVVFQISKKPVAVPSIAQEEFSGEKQIAEVPTSTEYFVSQNNGGTSVGSYDVKLTLNDADNYAWAGSANAEVTTIFQIVKVKNVWIENPTMSGWTYLSAESIPTAESRFGNEDLTITYKKDNGNGQIEELNDKPSSKGNYIVVFAVKGNNDYGDLLTELPFTISPYTVTTPSLTQVSTFNENEQFPILDTTYFEASSNDDEIIDAKSYNITLTLKDENFVWSDLTTVNKTLVFTINPAPNTDAVETSQTAIYGQTLSEFNVPTGTNGTWGWENSLNKVGTVNGENKHSLVFVPKNTNYAARTVVVIFNVEPYEVTAPTLTQETVYNSSVQAPVTDNTYYTTSCSEEIKNAKTYNLTLTLRDVENYVWKDNQSSANRTLTFVVKKVINTDSFELIFTATYGDTLSKVATPTSATGTWGWEDNTLAVGTVKGENKHKLVFAPTDSVNYATREVTVNFTVSPYPVSIPDLNQTSPYSGQKQNPVIDEKYYTASSNENPVNVKSYDFLLELKDKDNFIWNDLTVANKSLIFEITKVENAWITAPHLVGVNSGTSNFNFTFDNKTQKGSAKSKFGDVVYEYKTRSATTYSRSIPTNVLAEGYTIKISVAGNDNYTGLSSEIDFNILPVTPTITAPTFNSSNAYFQNTVNANDNTLWTNKDSAGAKFENQTIAGTLTLTVPEVKTTTASDITVNGIARKYTTAQATVKFIPTGNGAGNFTEVTTTTNINLYLVCYNYEYFVEKKWGITVKEYETIYNYFTSIEMATENVTSGKINIIPDKSGEVYIARPMIIAKGVTLEFAYQDGKLYKNRINTSNTATLSGETHNKFENLDLTSKIMVGNGVSITNNGTMVIAGELTGGGTIQPNYNPIAGNTAGKYVKIVLESNAKIINGSTGDIKCYGYIDESSVNNGSEVVVQNGTLGMPFLMHDYRGGNYLKSTKEAKISPFNQFEFRNIIPKLTIGYNGTLMGYANIYASSINFGIDVSFIKKGDSNAFINLNEGGYVVTKYTINDKGNGEKWYDGYLDMQFYGGFTANPLSLSFLGYNISTSNLPLPLCWRIRMTLNSGTYMMEQEYKFLPGTEFTIASDATVTMSKVNIYKTITNIAPPPITANTVYTQGKPAAKFTVYGNLTVTNIGGDVLASSNANITILGATTSPTQEVIDGYLENPDNILKKKYVITETITYDDPYEFVIITE